MIQIATSNISDTTVLMIDTRDLTNFYRQMNDVAKRRMTTRNITITKEEEEEGEGTGDGVLVKGIYDHAHTGRNDVCNFGMHSPLIRLMRYSSEVYRNLTLGDF
jgi:hypothetical protein